MRSLPDGSRALAIWTDPAPASPPPGTGLPWSESFASPISSAPVLVVTLTFETSPSTAIAPPSARRGTDPAVSPSIW